MHKLTAEPFKEKLIQPIAIGGNVLKTRFGYRVSLSNRNDITVYSELSPLPGLHKENAKEALKQLVQFQKQLETEYKNFLEFIKLVDINNITSLDYLQVPLYPSVRFSIEMLFWQMALICNEPMTDLFKKKFDQPLPVNALITDIGKLSHDELETMTSQLLEKKTTTLKLKIARDSLERETENILIMANRMPQAKFRFDSNRRFTVNQVETFHEKIKSIHNQIEYYEEPFFYKRDYEKISEYLPIAFDESVYENSEIMHDNNFLHRKKFVALVLKPQAIGGVIKTLQWYGRFYNHHKKFIISSTFESITGLKNISLLARLLINHDSSLSAAGLDTIRWFMNRDYHAQLLQATEKNPLLTMP